MSLARRVVQYTEDGAYVRTFDSIHEAQTYMNITHISSVCRHKRKSDGGYRWEYENDDEGRPRKETGPNWEW